jgi:RNA polymerase-binding transcription factor DksA
MSKATGQTTQYVVEKLRMRQAELLERLGRVRADRRHEHGALSADFEEQGVERENDEVLDVLDETERRELADIAIALERADAGAFGLCDACGGDIDPLRLEALPATPFCVGCARTHEADQAGSA